MTNPAGRSTPPASGPAPASDRESGRGRWLLVVRPRRITIICSISAAVVLIVMIVVGLLLLRSTGDGVYFRRADQIGLIGIGVVVAGGIMTGARPRLRVDATGLRVRNVLGEASFDWAVVMRVAFPEGVHWAQLLLADDERYPVMAIQSIDRERAVVALRRVRELMDRYAPPAPVLSPEAEEAAHRREQEEIARAAERPLGRLEEIDREKAAKAAAKRARSAPPGPPSTPDHAGTPGTPATPGSPGTTGSSGTSGSSGRMPDGAP
jgi:hypothetical protein